MLLLPLATVPLAFLVLANAQNQLTFTPDPAIASTTTASAAAYTPILSPYNETSYSPPFYPSPEVQGTGKWADAIAKAREYIANFTLEEKVALTTGVGWQGGRCVGNIPAIERVGWPGLCLQDSPLGVRFAEGVSAFPAGINVAATFDKDLAYQRGYAMVSLR
jgi:beta-glucosidase